MPWDSTDNRYARHAAIADLTLSVGTANNTLQDAGATYSQTIVNDNFKDLTEKVNAILTALRAANIISD